MRPQISPPAFSTRAGIVECTGKVLERTPVEKGARYAIEIPFAAELALGDSVAVNGCCLTVDRIEGTRVEFDLLTQTMRVTSLGTLYPGSICNLERAMSTGGRFGGHLVMGHVDATGTVTSVTPVGQDHMVRIRIPAEYERRAEAVDLFCLRRCHLCPHRCVQRLWPAERRVNGSLMQRGRVLCRRSYLPKETNSI